MARGVATPATADSASFAPPGWVVAGASVAGLSHERVESPCQDFHLTCCLVSPTGEQVLVMAVADGAGSARYGEQGSRIACEEILSCIEVAYSAGLATRDICEDDLHRWADIAAQRVENAAMALGLPSRDFASTLLLAVVGESAAAFAQLGDGAIVIRDRGQYVPVFWPQSGEYANTTYFLTDPSDRADLMVALRTDRHFDAVALFSDGLQHLALRYSDRSAHPAFFRSLFEQLSLSRGEDTELVEQSLGRFLRSDALRLRSDDDITLVLAVNETRAPKAHQNSESYETQSEAAAPSDAGAPAPTGSSEVSLGVSAEPPANDARDVIDSPNAPPHDNVGVSGATSASTPSDEHTLDC